MNERSEMETNSRHVQAQHTSHSIAREMHEMHGESPEFGHAFEP